MSKWSNRLHDLCQLHSPERFKAGDKISYTAKSGRISYISYTVPVDIDLRNKQNNEQRLTNLWIGCTRAVVGVSINSQRAKKVELAQKKAERVHNLNRTGFIKVHNKGQYNQGPTSERVGCKGLACWPVPDASHNGTKLETAHEWVDGLHNTGRPGC